MARRQVDTALEWLAGHPEGTYLDCHKSLGVSTTTFYRAKKINRERREAEANEGQGPPPQPLAGFTVDELARELARRGVRSLEAHADGSITLSETREL